jgi:hypothetical protein
VAPGAVPEAPALPPADFTVKGLAERLDRNASTVRAWCEAGQLEGAYRFQRREWRIPIAAVLAFEERSRRARVPREAMRPAQCGGEPADLGAWRRTG